MDEVEDAKPARDGERPTWISEHVPEDVISHLFKIQVKLPNNTVIPVDIETTTGIDYERLEEDLVSTPHQFVFWAAVYSESKQYVTILERGIKVRRGQMAEKVLDEARAKGVKLTDKALKEVVEADPALAKLETALAGAQKTTGKLWYMIEAMKMKSEHLRSLAGFKRQEMQQSR